MLDHARRHRVRNYSACAWLASGLALALAACSEPANRDADVLRLADAASRTDSARIAFRLAAAAYQVRPSSAAARQVAWRELIASRQRLGLRARRFEIEGAQKLAIDGSRIAAASEGAVLVAEIDSGRVRRFDLACTVPRGVALPQRDLVLVQCHGPEQVMMLDAHGGRRAAVPASGLLRMAHAGPYLLTAESDHATLWLLPGATMVRSFLHEDITALALDPGGTCAYTGSRDGRIRRWPHRGASFDEEWSAGGMVTELRVTEPCGVPWAVVSNECGTAPLMPGEAPLNTVSIEGRADVVLAPGARPARLAIRGQPARIGLAVAPSDEYLPFAFGGRPIWVLGMSPDARWVYTEDSEGDLRMFGGLRVPAAYEPIEGSLSLGSPGRGTHALSTDGRRLVLAVHDAVWLWDLRDTGRQFWAVPHVVSLRFADDGALAALSGQEGAVRLVFGGRVVPLVPPVRDQVVGGARENDFIVAAPEGAHVVRGGASRALPESSGSYRHAAEIGGVVTLITADGRLTGWRGDPGPRLHGRLPRDGYSSLFTQPGADQALAVGERGSYAIAWRAGEIDARPVASLSGHPVVSMDRRAVVHVARDGDDVLLRGADGRLERLRSGAWLGGSPVVSPDGRFIAAPRKRAVSVWTVGGERDPLVIDVHGRVTAIAWHPASDRLAIATLDSVRMVDLSATRLIASGCELLAHLGESRLSQQARLRHVPDGVRYADPCDNE